MYQSQLEGLEVRCNLVSARVEILLSVAWRICRGCVLNLQEVKLVNRDVVSFLATCETRGITLANCPAYIGEWIGKKHHRIKIK
jgi:hypothetical protein